MSRQGIDGGSKTVVLPRHGDDMLVSRLMMIVPATLGQVADSWQWKTKLVGGRSLSNPNPKLQKIV